VFAFVATDGIGLAERERMLTRVAKDAERALRAVEQTDGLLDEDRVASAHGCCVS
jgi:hypothetical protein